MYDGKQLIKVKWNNTNREWYESKGYKFTKRYDSFWVKAEDLSVHSAIKIKAVCDYCGCEYITQYSTIMNGRNIINKDCCSHCTGLKTSDVSKKQRANKKFNLVKNICEKYQYKLITTVDEYIDCKMLIKFICPIHGEQNMIIDNLIRGHTCIKCSYEKRSENLKHDINYIKSQIEKINGNVLLNPNDYKNAITHNLNIKCSCGKTFITSFSNYVKHGVNQCSSCSCKESRGELKIRQYLENRKIEFIQEKRFIDCRDKKSLPFDFYLPDYNLIIEFDGQHHYYPTYGKLHHQKTIKHDKIKNKYCVDNNYQLLRIPYWCGDDINDILDNAIKT